MSTVRALTADELEAFRTARLVSGEHMPYFLHALFSVHPVAAPGLGTFAVDAHWRLYLDPALLLGPDAWPVPLAAAVLLHEVGHLIRDHADRSKDLAPQPIDFTAWNYATDAEINDDLLAAGIDLPDGVITPGSLGCREGLLAEDYYAMIQPPHPDPNHGPAVDFGDEPGCGSGSGDRVQAWELPADSSAAPRLDPADADLVRTRVAHDVIAHSAGRGTAPAGLARWAEATLAVPRVPWYQLLRTVLRRAIANRAGLTHHTYSRPSRRRAPGTVLPARRGNTVRVAVVVDTSASMTSDDLGAALTEIGGVMRANIDRDNLVILSCDAASSTPQRISTLEHLRLVGGGGTDMRVGIAAASATRPAPDLVVVLTDGGTPWPDQPSPRHNLVCVVIGNAHATTPPWAHTVHIPTGAGSEVQGARR